MKPVVSTAYSRVRVEPGNDEVRTCPLYQFLRHWVRKDAAGFGENGEIKRLSRGVNRDTETNARLRVQAKLKLWDGDLLGQILFRGEDGDADDEECRTTREQIKYCIAALANAARLEVVPLITYMSSKNVGVFDVAANFQFGGRTNRVTDFFRSSYWSVYQLLALGSPMPRAMGLRGEENLMFEI